MATNEIADKVSKNLSGYVTPVKDYNFKIVVLNKLNATMSQLSEIANYNFLPHMVAGGFFSVYHLAYLILPYVSEDSNHITIEINKTLELLKINLANLESYSFSDLTKYVHQCNYILTLLIPLLSYIGISNRQSAVGTFSFPGQHSKIDKPVSDILDEDDDEDMEEEE